MRGSWFDRLTTNGAGGVRPEPSRRAIIPVWITTVFNLFPHSLSFSFQNLMARIFALLTLEEIIRLVKSKSPSVGRSYCV